MLQTHNRLAVQYIAEVRNTQEISLYGTADLPFWKEILAKDGLVPLNVGGCAEVLISAARSRYLGVRFEELIIAVTVAQESNCHGPGTYLVSAYNSSRTFAFIERTFFRTPYLHGNIDVQSGSEPGFCLKEEMGNPIAARRAPVSRPSHQEELVWNGAIYLPPRNKRSVGTGNVFYARLSGLTEVCSFVRSEDTLAISLHEKFPVFGWLIESGFAGREWYIRDNATHARSKTYRRQ